MYIVNTSFFVDASVQNTWLDIIRAKFIPFLRSEGCNVIAFSRVLSNEAAEHSTYSLLVDAPELEQYSRYVDELYADYSRLADAMFGAKVTTLMTLMKKMD